MNKALKKKWVNALRSGEYKQGGNRLYNKKYDSFCCLGVLCDVAGIDRDEIWDESMPTRKQAKAIGLPYADEGVDYDTKKNITAKLANFNDDGKSFKWIASYIERYL